MTAKAAAAVTTFSRDEGHAVRLAAARAAGHLALAELRGGLPGASALPALVPVMVALVGTDQSSEVQRQMLLVRLPPCLLRMHRCSYSHRDVMAGRGRLLSPFRAQVLRKLAAESPQALVPHYATLVPALVGLLQQTQGPTKLSGDRTLGKLLQVRCHSPVWAPNKTKIPIRLMCGSCMRRWTKGRMPCTTSLPALEPRRYRRHTSPRHACADSAACRYQTLMTRASHDS